MHVLMDVGLWGELRVEAAEAPPEEDERVGKDVKNAGSGTTASNATISPLEMGS
jgi:hypothetical protein